MHCHYQTTVGRQSMNQLVVGQKAGDRSCSGSGTRQGLLDETRESTGGKSRHYDGQFYFDLCYPNCLVADSLDWRGVRNATCRAQKSQKLCAQQGEFFVTFDIALCKQNSQIRCILPSKGLYGTFELRASTKRSITSISSYILPV